MSNLHSSKIVDIPQPPEDYRPQHPTLHLEPAEGPVGDLIKLATWIENKTSDRGDKAAHLLIEYDAERTKKKELEKERENIEVEPDTKNWLGYSYKNKKLKKNQKELDKIKKNLNKIASKIREVYRIVQRNKKIYDKNTDDDKPYEVFYEDLEKELGEEGLDSDKIEELVLLFKELR